MTVKKFGCVLNSFSGNLRGVVANVLDCCLEVSESKLQSRYNIPFRINALHKRMNPFILRAMG